MKKLGIALLSLLVTPLFGYVVGYSRLYDPVSGKTVDLLYDAHISEKGLTIASMHKMPVASLEKKLYPTERFLLKRLAELNNRGHGSTAIIWEQGPHEDAVDPQFIGFSKRLVEKRFPHLSFVRADRSRDALEELFMSRSRRTLTKKRYGCSFAEPVPLPDKRIARILGYSGDEAWTIFKRHHKSVTSAFRRRYKRSYMAGRVVDSEDLYEQAPFDRLCDIEMISHILSAPQKRVIVYAGSWHCENIANFLCGRLQFESLYEGHTYETELPLSELRALGR